MTVGVSDTHAWVNSVIESELCVPLPVTVQPKAVLQFRGVVRFFLQRSSEPNNVRISLLRLETVVSGENT